MSTLKVNKIQSLTEGKELIITTGDETAGSIGISGSLEVSGSITPQFANEYYSNIGSNSKPWNSGSFGYVSGSAGEFGHLKLGSGSATPGATNVRVEDLPTSDPSVSGRLFTQSGSELFGGSVTGSGAFNISSSVFVLISQG